MGIAGQLFGVVLIVIGSIDLIRQLATGVPLNDLEWPLFIIVGGFGIGVLLFVPWLTLLMHHVFDEPNDEIDDNVVDDFGDAFGDGIGDCSGVDGGD